MYRAKCYVNSCFRLLLVQAVLSAFSLPLPRHHVAISHNTQQEKEELQRRIRGLTTILHKFAVQTGPSKQPRDNHSLLRHFTTLLTCGSKYDTDAKRVVAVTGSIDSVRPVRTLVVSQNPHKNSTVQSISLKLVKKRHRSLNEVVAGYYSHGFE